MRSFELAQGFDGQRSRLTGVAFRMLGSLSEAEDAVQETWLRLQRADAESVENLDGWLTTVISRICLNMLRGRRRHDPLDPAGEPIVSLDTTGDPEHQALLADAVGVALQVVLATLSPAQRLAFVLHDMFSVPFEVIAPLVERSPQATRQLASRARRQVHDAAPLADPDPAIQRAAVQAYFAAARQGDIAALVAVLDPSVILRAHGRDGVTELRGADRVARGAVAARAWASTVRPALINGAAGVVAFDGDIPFAVLAFTVTDGRIVNVDVFNDRDRVQRLIRT
ncbi:sigma-70 family RNA polymerase sigma factor [Nakamurella sp. A5-74]|uniref:Sigma-70 family RNA polymerase sigma factor n=1 Tax=Nakamurella sp. A5-74 TaxID=3158264 RepID=A0AAU8DNQ8_9ACTN